MQTAYNYPYKLKTICRWMFLLLFVLGFNVVQAQESGRIIGTVLDKGTGDPLPGANILLDGTSLGAATTVDGKYTIRQVPPGNYNLIIKYIGYKEQEIPITVTSGKTLEINVELEQVAVETEK